MKLKSKMKGYSGLKMLFLIYFLFWVSVVGGLIWVAIHFISKFW